MNIVGELHVCNIFPVPYKYILLSSHIPTLINLHIICTTEEYATHTFVSLTLVIHPVIILILLTTYSTSHLLISIILFVLRRITTPLIFRAILARKIDPLKDDSACNNGSQECTLIMGSLIILITTHPISILPSILLPLLPLILPLFHMNIPALTSPYTNLNHIATLRSPLSPSIIITLMYLSLTPSTMHTIVHLSPSMVITITLILITLLILLPLIFIILILTLNTLTTTIISLTIFYLPPSS